MQSNVNIMTTSYPHPSAALPTPVQAPGAAAHSQQAEATLSAIVGMGSVCDTLIEGMSEGIVILDATGVILYCNGRLAQILAVPVSRILGSSFQQWLLVADVPRFAALLQDGMRDEFNLSHAGKLIAVQLVVMAVQIADRDAFACKVTDLSSHQNAEIRMKLEHDVARILAEADIVANSIANIIHLICHSFGWACGMRWHLKGESLQLAENWCDALLRLPGGGRVSALKARQDSAMPACVSALAQEALLGKQPVWREQLHFDTADGYQPSLVCTEQTGAKLAITAAGAENRPIAALAVPVLSKAEQQTALSVLTFFGHDMPYPEPAVWQTLSTICNQIGLFLLRKQTESVLQLRESALEASTEAIFIACYGGKHGEHPIEFVNPAFENITGYSAAEVLGMDLLRLQQLLCPDMELTDIVGALREKRPGHALTHNRSKDGSRFWSELHIAPVRGEHGRTSHFIGIQNDVTLAMQHQSVLKYQANHDALTGLPNRNLLNQRLRQSISAAQRKSSLLALVFVDLDHFKLINDSLGHEVGDLVLKSIAERMKTCLRETDTAARPGGDEFVLILMGEESTDSVTAVIRRILAEIAQPIPFEGRELYVTCSIGISIYRQDGEDIGTLLRNADTAMYYAKERGRNNFQFFNSVMNQRVHERFMLESNLRQAIVENRLALNYQPQIDIKSGRMIGMEALLRWHHPELGLISPTKFIPIAEESNLIISIGEWVLRTACLQNKRWQDAGLPCMTMAVNLSARQFRQDKLAQTVAIVLAETGLEAQYLELELTESLALEDLPKFMQTLNQLKALGLQLTIDDFGTGYSSLSYLKHFPLDRLKIDMSLVHDIVSNRGDAAISSTIITLGHNLGLKVLAEGVETREQLVFLSAQGCDEIQGFFFSEPLSTARLEKLLKGPADVSQW